MSAGTANTPSPACTRTHSLRGTTEIWPTLRAISSHHCFSRTCAQQLVPLYSKTNCHPFRHGSWLFVHNGVIRGYDKLKWDLAFNIDPALFPAIQGTTDSELMFNLALTFGLEHEPFAALERMAGLIEKTGEKHSVSHPLQMTLGLSDGKRLYAVLYSSERLSRTLYHSKSMEALRQINPDLERFSRDARAIVSEPLSDVREYWAEIPESSALVIEGGEVHGQPFQPRPLA